MFNLKKALIPTPVKVNDGNAVIKIGEYPQGNFTFTAKGEGEVFSEAVKYIDNAFIKNTGEGINTCGEYAIVLEINSSNPQFEGRAEAYSITVSESGATLCGSDEAGAYYAAVTFAKLIYSEGASVCLPVCDILDYPRFATRGHFMECRYGSDFMTYEDWKNGIDYLSEMKINKVVCGLYGCWSRQYDGDFAEYLYIPFQKYPELRTPRNIKYYSAKERAVVYKKDILPTMFEDDYFGKLAAYGKKKNIEVIPLFNSLGHNTLIPRIFPEISAVDENGNYSSLGFCTNNDKTYEIMFDIYDEIIDRYLTPYGIDSFEIGLDEVWKLVGVNPDNLQEERSPFCQCDKCRGRDYGDLMVEYIIRITKHLKEKGIKNVYVYNDMLFNHGKLTQETAELFKREGIYDNIIIDWWSYNAEKERNFSGRIGEVNNIFRSVGKSITGYFHWNMPTQTNENIYIITELSEEKKFEGMIAYSSFEYCYDFNYLVFAECAWRGIDAADSDELLERYAYTEFPDAYSEALSALRSAQEFTWGRYSRTNKATDIFEYYVSSYLHKGKEYPVSYPANAFCRLRENEKELIAYLRTTIQKADYTYDFFDKNISSAKGDIWKLIALQYSALCDEFLTVYTCAGAYNDGLIDEFAFVSELERIIRKRDKTIALCEDVRIKANQYICIRDMTIIRQAVCDLLDYMKSEINNGNKPEVDIFDFNRYLSKESWFLR